jgi:rare lipoprotein A
MQKPKFACLLFSLFLVLLTQAQEKIAVTVEMPANTKIYYGTASYYADMFNGRPTANGEVYSHDKMTAACNILPLGTWIRVTNMRNGKSVIVKTNDRLHVRMKRIVDLSKSAAQQLGYIGRGLTQVRVEVLEKVRPSKSSDRDK